MRKIKRYELLAVKYVHRVGYIVKTYGYLCMVTLQLNYCDHFEMHRNIINMLCTKNQPSIVGQLYFKNKKTNLRKKDGICDYHRRGVGAVGIGRRQSKVQTSSYETNKY